MTRYRPTDDDPFSPWQIRALAAAYSAKLHGDGWLMRSFSGVWQRAPLAIHALARKQLVTLSRDRSRAKLTAKGINLIEAEPEKFGLTIRTRP